MDSSAADGTRPGTYPKTRLAGTENHGTDATGIRSRAASYSQRGKPLTVPFNLLQWAQWFQWISIKGSYRRAVRDTHPYPQEAGRFSEGRTENPKTSRGRGRRV